MSSVFSFVFLKLPLSFFTATVSNFIFFCFPILWPLLTFLLIPSLLHGENRKTKA